MNPNNQNQPQHLSNGLFYKAQTRWLFHAHIKIKIPVFCDDDLFDDLFSVLENVDRLYNSYSSGSYFDLINKNAGNFVEVDQETVSILQDILAISDLFDDEYDITIMPLIRLWGFYKNDEHRVPSVSEINGVKRLIDYRRIEIDGCRVRIGKGQEIITGSFIKAYAVDKLIDRMKFYGIMDAIVNAGGSTIKALNNKTHPHWQIDITDPDNKDENLFNLKLANACFSTSAQSKTFVEIDGQKYGHILSPVTGFPSRNKQVGVISETCFVGDIVSTALFNQSLDTFKLKMDKISEKYPVSGFLMDENKDVCFYGGFDDHIKK